MFLSLTLGKILVLPFCLFLPELLPSACLSLCCLFSLYFSQGPVPHLAHSGPRISGQSLLPPPSSTRMWSLAELLCLAPSSLLAPISVHWLEASMLLRPGFGFKAKERLSWTESLITKSILPETLLWKFRSKPEEEDELSAFLPPMSFC